MNFLFTCGGTAGHINPAVAVAGELREAMPDCGILFVGADGMMEERLVPQEGFDIKTVTITNLSRKKNLAGLKHNIATLKNIFSATRQARKIIEDFKPDAAIGTGGYVCYPVLKAASAMGIPTAMHESNAVPGLTTKLLSSKVDRIMVGFPESKNAYKNPEKVTVTGTPVRGGFSRFSKEEARRELGIPAGKKLVLSVWGSLGAAKMNEIFTGLIPLAAAKGDFCLVHSAGTRGYAAMAQGLGEICPGYAERGMDVREYIFDMPLVMAAADLIICRAGASTLAELTCMGKPAVLVPSPNVTNNHQEKNARVLENAGGARVLLEGEFDGESLLELTESLLADDKALAEMSAAMKALGAPRAAEAIAEIVLSISANNR